MKMISPGRIKVEKRERGNLKTLSISFLNIPLMFFMIHLIENREENIFDVFSGIFCKHILDGIR